MSARCFGVKKNIYNYIYRPQFRLARPPAEIQSLHVAWSLLEIWTEERRREREKEETEQVMLDCFVNTYKPKPNFSFWCNVVFLRLIVGSIVRKKKKERKKCPPGQVVGARFLQFLDCLFLFREGPEAGFVRYVISISLEGTLHGKPQAFRTYPWIERPPPLSTAALSKLVS